MLKKIFLLLASSALVFSTANADTICIKKKVTSKNAVSLARNIKVIQGEECPKGFVKLLDTQTFVGPQGEKGDKGDKGDAGLDGANYYDTEFLPPKQKLTGLVGGRGAVYVSLQVPSSVQLEIAESSECDGSVEMPTAPKGKVCIYPIFGTVHAESVPTSSKMVLNTRTLCEANGYEWKDAYCLANKPDGVTPIDSDTECFSGPYANENHWDDSTEICTRPRWDKENCETPLNDWDDEKACFVEGVLNHADETQCAQEVHGYWIEKGCSDESFSDKKSCLAPSIGTWIPAACEVTEIGSDGFYSDYSNAGFRVVSSNGAFAAVWAYTAPEIM